jgi:flagellar FliL protein
MADAAIATPELTGRAAKKANKKAAKGADDAKSGGKKKILLLVALLLIAALGFVVKTKVMAAPAGPVKPVPGAVLPATGMYINLANNHFLKLGLGLQETASAPKTTDASAAQQAAIFLFLGEDYKKLMDPKYVETLRQKLVAEVAAESNGDIYDVKFTDFVMQ